MTKEKTTKEKILEIAEQEFSAYGYDSVSMNNLVEKLGINKATIYYHFKNKEELYHQVFLALAEIQENAMKSIVDIDLPAKEFLKLYLSTIVNTLEQRPTMIPMFFREIANYGGNFNKDTIPEFIAERKIIIKLLSSPDIKEKYKKTEPMLIQSLAHSNIKLFYAMKKVEENVEGFKESVGCGECSMEELKDFLYEVLIDALFEKK